MPARVTGGAGGPDLVAPSDAEPESVVLARESLAEACFTVLTRLTPTQRAVLILRGVLCWSASDTAMLPDSSGAAVNSALQRARAALAATRAPEGLAGTSAPAMRADTRTLLDRYLDVLGRRDATAAIELVRTEVLTAA